MEVVGPIRASSASVSKCDLAIPIDESPSVSLCLRESQEPSANTSFRAGGGAGFQGEVNPACRVNLVDPKIAQSDQQRQAATQRFGKLLTDKNGRPERSPLATSTGRPRVEFRPREANWKAAGSVWQSIHFVCGAAGDTEAQVIVPVRRLVPVAVRRPAVLGGVVPASAPDHPVHAHRPLTERCCSTRVRNRQLFVPPAVVKANSAVARSCNAFSLICPAS